MCIYMNIGQCITKLQSGREFVHRNQKKGDNSVTENGRVMVLVRDMSSPLG